MIRKNNKIDDIYQITVRTEIALQTTVLQML